MVPLYQGKLKITEAKFYRVSGDSTQHRGVVPDIKFPSLYPYDEVGESALEHALPWDRIQSAPHYLFADTASVIPVLQSKHNERIQNNTEYNVLLKQKNWLEEQRKRKTLPLNYASRAQQKKNDDATALALSNEVRKSKNLPLLNTISELEESNQKKRDEKNPSDDYLLMESARILIDMIAVQSPNNRDIAASQ